VCFHIVSPYSAGLFQHAIMESGSCATGIVGQASQPSGQGLDAWGYARQYEMQSALIEQLGCLPSSPTPDANEWTLNCLRNLPAVALQEAEGLLQPLLEPYFPVEDGFIVPDVPLNLFIQGRFNRDVNFITGINTNEGTLFSDPSFNQTQFEEYVAYGAGTEFLAPVLSLYNPEMAPYNISGAPIYYALAELITDYFFVCPARRMLNLASRWQSPNHVGNNYFYHFNHEPSWIPR